MLILIHRPQRVPLIVTAAAALLLLLLSSGLPDLSAGERYVTGRTSSKPQTVPLAENAVDPAVLRYLENDFCSGDLCPPGGWKQWIILTPDDAWTVEELQTLHAVLLAARAALDQIGLDGNHLLRGYRFRNMPRIYLDASRGVLARVRHDRQEIELSDGTLYMQWGFFLYHELAHVADIRLDHALTREFQRATLGNAGVGSEQTADGFWLDNFARDEPGEAMADAFALWVMLYHTADPQPVFWLKPEDADYEKIAQAMETALQRAAGRQ